MDIFKETPWNVLVNFHLFVTLLPTVSTIEEMVDIQSEGIIYSKL